MPLPIAHDDPDSWRQRTPDEDIPFRVISREGTFEIERASATEVYVLQATDLLAFVNETFPAPIPVGGLLRYPITRRMPGFPEIHTTSIKWKAHVGGLPIDPFSSDPNAPVNTYGVLANLTIEYETGKNNENKDDENTFLEISCQATGEFLHTTAPKGKWDGSPGEIAAAEAAVAAGGQPDPCAPGQVVDPVIPAMVVVPELEWSVGWPRIPWSFFRGRLIGRMRDKLGHVNSDVLKVLFDAPAETILFAGFSYSESYTWRGGSINTPPITIDMKFLEKHILNQDDNEIIGHNHAWRPGCGWRRLLHDGANPLYQSVLMSELFQPLEDEPPANDDPGAVELLEQAIQNAENPPANPDPPAP